MCGIAGLLHVDPARPADGERVRAMCATLVHRAPDSDGFQHLNGMWAFALRDDHRRGSVDHGVHIWILLQLAVCASALGLVRQRA